MTKTELCNMALARIGDKRINDFETDASTQGIHCRLHYEQTKKALLRSFRWNFASKRVALSEDSSTPLFEWDHQYLLPSDFLRLRFVYEDDGVDTEDDRFEIEGRKILTNYDTCNIKYIRDVTDPTEFDALFVELLVLRLAWKLINPLAGTNANSLKDDVKEELKEINRKAQAVSAQETNVAGREDWDLSRTGS